MTRPIRRGAARGVDGYASQVAGMTAEEAQAADAEHDAAAEHAEDLRERRRARYHAIKNAPSHDEMMERIKRMREREKRIDDHQRKMKR
jgi:hypothetical protein